MKRWMLALFLALVFLLAGCKPDGTADLMELDEVSALVSEKGFTGEDFKEKLSGQFHADVVRSWGEPDGHLSGFWGDIWTLGDGDSRYIILYYDEEGYVEDVVEGTNESPNLAGTVSRNEAEEIALAECRVNDVYLETEFDADGHVWEIGFWEDGAALAAQTVFIDAVGNVLGTDYAE